MKKFDIPNFYRSDIISKIKSGRKLNDPRKQDYSPTELDFGPVRFYIARHFGFCYGVENAIEISYRTIDENPDKKIYLLSEMIHNPGVNEDLQSRGVRFIMDTFGNQIVDWEELKPDDIVIIPAFGTTIQIEEKLKNIGIDIQRYNTTCPFVEKVWNRSLQLGERDYTVIIHGKAAHEETRATFSHSKEKAASLIVRDIEETKFIASIILGEIPGKEFYKFFNGKYSEGFDVEKDLQRIGVVNQTTMLATETQAIADFLKETMIKKYGIENLKDHFADTRDTLCYATNDNQEATIALLNIDADFAIVVGGYNSSNTSHLVELCEQKFTTYFISSEEKILSDKEISHYNILSGAEEITPEYIPLKDKVNIALTSGASCPDAVVDSVIKKLLGFFDGKKDLNEVLDGYFTKS